MNASGQLGAPPSDVDAERAVLGAVLVSADAAADVFGVLAADDFYDPGHVTVFSAAAELFATGQPVDVVTVSAALVRFGQMPPGDGAGLVHGLAASVATVANVAWYVRIVADKAKLRRLLAAGMRIVAEASSQVGDADRVADRASEEVFAATAGRGASAGLEVRQVVSDTLEEMARAAAAPDGLSGVPTGLPGLDRLTGGWQGGQMVVVAGRPAMGKSAFALDAVRAAAAAGVASAVFSLEMPSREIGQRLLSAAASVPLTHVRSGRLSEAEWVKVSQAAPTVSGWPVTVDDDPSVTMMSIRSKCRRIAARSGLGLVVVDYLQLLSAPRRVENRQQEVAEFSRSAKLLAKELGVPVMVLSQLNRSAETRADRRPMLSDLRESGAIEQDADVVVLLHREDVYDDRSPRAGEADVMVVKHRNGPTATIPAAFQGHYSRFAPLAG